MLLFVGYKVLSIFAVTWGWGAVLPFLSFAKLSVLQVQPGPYLDYHPTIKFLP